MGAIRKKSHQTLLASFVRSALHALNPCMPLAVCAGCVRPTDKVILEDNGFSICDRCRAAVADTFAVRERFS